MSDRLEELTDKEKETLRLVLRGHDAKSMARALDLSVHTINDRLRAARRKLSVTSSREAARLLFERESERTENLVGKPLGEAGESESAALSGPSNGRRGDGRSAGRILAWSAGGLLAMSLILSLLLLSSPHAGTDAPGPPDSRSETIASADAETEAAARAWLAAVDRADWSKSYEETGSSFRKLNTLAGWQSASEQARPPLGDVVAREAIAFDDLYAPPHGYCQVRFRTDFAARKGVVETVVLEREGTELRVVGYVID